jgi:hypothetical protein
MAKKEFRNMPYYDKPTPNIELSINLDTPLDPLKDYEIKAPDGTIKQIIDTGEPNKFPSNITGPIIIKDDIVNSGDSIQVINKNNTDDVTNGIITSKKEVVPVKEKKTPYDRKDTPVDVTVKNNIDKVFNDMSKKSKRGIKKLEDDNDLDIDSDDQEDETSWKFAKAKEKGASINRLIDLMKN